MSVFIVNFSNNSTGVLPAIISLIVQLYDAVSRDVVRKLFTLKMHGVEIVKGIY